MRSSYEDQLDSEFGEEGVTRAADDHWVKILLPGPVAPPKLLDVVSCRCGARDKACSTDRCSCWKTCLFCTTYCVCEDGDQCENRHDDDDQEDVQLEPQQPDDEFGGADVDERPQEDEPEEYETSEEYSDHYL